MKRTPETVVLIDCGCSAVQKIARAVISHLGLLLYIHLCIYFLNNILLYIVALQ